MSVCARKVRAVSAKDIYAGSTPVTDSNLNHIPNGKGASQ